MNRIVREHYPVDKLPEDLREGIPAGEQVTVVVETEAGVSTRDTDIAPPQHVMTLEEIFAARRPPFRSSKEISDTIRRDRDAWE
jgi:hypothetical protein